MTDFQTVERIAVLEAELRNLREAMRIEGEKNRQESAASRAELAGLKESLTQLLMDARAGSKVANWVKTAAALASIGALWTGVVAWIMQHTK